MRVRIMPRSASPAGGRGLCYGRPEDWDSRSPLIQRWARVVCDSPCPIRTWCDAEAKRLVLDGVVVEGVWGGRYYPHQEEA